MIDLSHPLHAGTPVFPGDPPLAVELLDSTRWPTVAGERRLNSSRLRLGLHVGTHMDAPFHFHDGGRTIDQIDLEACCGPALRIRLTTPVIDAADLAARADEIRTAGRVVLDTGWHKRWGQADYFRDHPVLTGGAAELLVALNTRLVGVDFPSVDRPPFPAHLVLLGAGVLIVENLTNLDALADDHFHLTALPLKLSGRDGSPVRAIAR